MTRAAAIAACLLGAVVPEAPAEKLALRKTVVIAASALLDGKGAIRGQPR